MTAGGDGEAAAEPQPPATADAFDRTSPPREDSIARNAAFSLASQLTTGALTAALTVFLVRALKPNEYGLFALGLSINSILLLLADFGISSSTSRFLAERRSQPETLGPILVDSLKLKVLLSGVMCLTVFVLADPISIAYGEPRLGWVLRGMALATLGQSLLLMSFGVFSALSRISVRYWVVVIESLMEVFASVVLVLLVGGAASATFGRAVGYAVGGAVGIGLALWIVGRPRLALSRPPSRAAVSKIGRYAGYLLVVDAAHALSGSINMLLIGAYLGSTASGIFNAPYQFIIFMQYPAFALSSAVAPRLARDPGRKQNVGAFAAALRGLTVFACMAIAPSILWAGPIVDLLLGPAYARSADVLTTLTPCIFFTALAPLVSVSLNYLGEARRRVPIAVLSLVLLVGLTVALIPKMGVVGAAVAVDVSSALYVSAHLMICWRLVRMPLRPLLLTLSRALTAAAAMGAVLALVGTHGLTVTQMVAGGAGGIAAYFAVLVALRELTTAELLGLPTFLRRRLSSR